MAEGLERWLWIVWTDGLIMKEKVDVIFPFFFLPQVLRHCVDSFRHHKLGKLISNAFLRGRVGEGRNLVKIIILRGASQNSLSKRRTKVHMNLLALV